MLMRTSCQESRESRTWADSAENAALTSAVQAAYEAMHDLNNILTGIAAYAVLLKAEKAGSCEAASFIDAIERSVEKGGRVTARLLALMEENGVTPARVLSEVA